MAKMRRTIAIVGGGPAGACLGFLLAKRGWKTAIFHSDKRPPLVVGESLIPAVIPLLRKLGIEAEVKAFSIYKPGATICLNLNEVITAPFTFAEGKLPDYAYNAPRDLFDQAVLNAAERAGAKIFRTTAKLERGELPDTVRLSRGTLSRADGFFEGQPEFIVDASGRNRLIPRLLDHPAMTGDRNDVALFAHLSSARIHDAGHIHLDYLTKGWAWRVPLPGRVSLGIVINPAHLKQYGNSVEKQFDAYIREEPSLKVHCQGSTRVSPVMKYNNYQLISERLHGPGWMLVGDSAGFVDPVFSSGLYLGLKGAFDACDALEANTGRAMRKYQNQRKREFQWWQEVIASWYNGQLFNLVRAGRKYSGGAMGAGIERQIRRRLARVLTGEATSDRSTMRLFDYMITMGMALRDPADLVVV
jgi:flavin-dependent dehydrogenase